MTQNKLRVKGVNSGGGVILPQLITFTKADYGTDVDVISQYLTLKRGNNAGLFNTNEGATYNGTFEGGKNHLWCVANEGDFTYDSYVDLWNTFDPSTIDITQLQSDYENGGNLFDFSDKSMVPWGRVHNSMPLEMLNKEMIMLDVLDGKFYKVKFTQWTNGGAGGGLSYTRQLFYSVPEVLVVNLTLPFNANDGDTIDGQFGSSTGYYKVEYWDGTSEVLGDGKVYDSISMKADGISSFYKQFNSSDLNNGQIVITSCTSYGSPSGDIIFVALTNPCYGNFDVNSLTNLTYLHVQNNESLTSLNVSSLRNLTYLDINDNQLTEILFPQLIPLGGVMMIPELKSLQVIGNPLLTTLIGLNNSNLTSLKIENNNSLTSLDVSGLSNLPSLEINSNTSLTSLDVTGLINATLLRVYDNTSLTSLIGLTDLTNLTSLFVYYTSLTSLDITGLSNLIYLQARENPFGGTGYDNLLIELDTNGTSGGTFAAGGSTFNRTSASNDAFANLIDKGWSLDM